MSRYPVTISEYLEHLERLASYAQDLCETRRRDLAHAAGDGATFDSLAEKVAYVAHADGAAECVAHAAREAAYQMRADVPPADLAALEALVFAGLARTVLRGADDTWSGRGNDARRSKFDGYRECADRHFDR